MSYSLFQNVRLIIVIMLLLISVHFSNDTNAQTRPSIEYRSLKHAGVKIPIRDYVIQDDNKLEFDIYREDISLIDYVWSWLWGKNFGYYMTGVDPKNKSLQCPFIGEKQKLPGSKIQKVGDGKYHVRLILSRPLIAAVIANQCAVSPKPRKAPEAGNNNSRDNKNKNSGIILSPISYFYGEIRYNSSKL